MSIIGGYSESFASMEFSQEFHDFRMKHRG